MVLQVLNICTHRQNSKVSIHIQVLIQYCLKLLDPKAGRCSVATDTSLVAKCHTVEACFNICNQIIHKLAAKGRVDCWKTQTIPWNCLLCLLKLSFGRCHPYLKRNILKLVFLDAKMSKSERK